jgi:hypothetical protein
LVERLLALVVAAAEAGAAVPTDGVDLVDEDDAGRVLLALLEEIAHAAGADADEHLDEVGARDAEEGHARLARDGAREQRLAGAGRADAQDALRDAAAEALELLRIFEEGDDLFDLVFGLVDAGHVGERHLVLRLVQQARARLAEAHRLAAAGLQLPHEEVKHQHQEDHRQQRHQGGHPDRVALFFEVTNGDVVVDEVFGDRIARGAQRLVRLLGLRRRIDDVKRVLAVFDLDPLDVFLLGLALDPAHKLAERHRLGTAVFRADELPDGHEHQDEQDPEEERFLGLLHGSCSSPVVDRRVQAKT